MNILATLKYMGVSTLGVFFYLSGQTVPSSTGCTQYILPSGRIERVGVVPNVEVLCLVDRSPDLDNVRRFASVYTTKDHNDSTPVYTIKSSIQNGTLMRDTYLPGNGTECLNTDSAGSLYKYIPLETFKLICTALPDETLDYMNRNMPVKSLEFTGSGQILDPIFRYFMDEYSLEEARNLANAYAVSSFNKMKLYYILEAVSNQLCPMPDSPSTAQQPNIDLCLSADLGLLPAIYSDFVQGTLSHLIDQYKQELLSILANPASTNHNSAESKVMLKKILVLAHAEEDSIKDLTAEVQEFISQHNNTYPVSFGIWQDTQHLPILERHLTQDRPRVSNLFIPEQVSGEVHSNPSKEEVSAALPSTANDVYNEFLEMVNNWFKTIENILKVLKHQNASRRTQAQAIKNEIKAEHFGAPILHRDLSADQKEAILGKISNQKLFYQRKREDYHRKFIMYNNLAAEITTRIQGR